jgi:hypothetical protein
MNWPRATAARSLQRCGRGTVAGITFREEGTATVRLEFPPSAVPALKHYRLVFLAEYDGVALCRHEVNLSAQPQGGWQSTDHFAILEPIANANVDQARPSTPDPWPDSLAANTWGYNTRAFFLVFDLRSIPPDAHVQNARLRIIPWARQGTASVYLNLGLVADPASINDTTTTWMNMPAVIPLHASIGAGNDSIDLNLEALRPYFGKTQPLGLKATLRGGNSNEWDNSHWFTTLRHQPQSGDPIKLIVHYRTGELVRDPRPN